MVEFTLFEAETMRPLVHCEKPGGLCFLAQAPGQGPQNRPQNRVPGDSRGDSREPGPDSSRRLGLWAKLDTNFLRLPADLAIRTALGDREGAITTTFFQESHLLATESASFALLRASLSPRLHRGDRQGG
jgi:hypothetical protein